MKKISKKNQFNDLETILNITSYISGKTKEDIIGTCRKRELVDARHAFIIVATDLSDISYIKIGAKVNKDHSNVSYVVETKRNIRNISELVKKIKKALTDTKISIIEIYDNAIKEKLMADEFSNKIIELMSFNNKNIYNLVEKINKSVFKLENLKYNTDIVYDELKKIYKELNNITSLLI